MTDVASGLFWHAQKTYLAAVNTGVGVGGVGGGDGGSYLCMQQTAWREAVSHSRSVCLAWIWPLIVEPRVLNANWTSRDGVMPLCFMRFRHDCHLQDFTVNAIGEGKKKKTANYLKENSVVQVFVRAWDYVDLCTFEVSSEQPVICWEHLVIITSQSQSATKKRTRMIYSFSALTVCHHESLQVFGCHKLTVRVRSAATNFSTALYVFVWRKSFIYMYCTSLFIKEQPNGLFLTELLILSQTNISNNLLFMPSGTLSTIVPSSIS